MNTINLIKTYKNIFLLFISFSPIQAYGHSSVLKVNVNNGEIASYDDNFLSKVSQLAGSGVTPTFRPDNDNWKKLNKLGLKRIRLINVDRDVKVKINKNEIYEVVWPSKLKDELKIAKEKKFIPFIVISQKPPIFYINGINTNFNINEPEHWVLYKKYISLLIEYVSFKWDFKYSEWEIGNEFNNPKNNWMNSHVLSRNDSTLYRYYLDIYKNLSVVFRDFKINNPGVNLKIGGPGFSDAVYNSWTVDFLDSVVKNNLPCDFISLHYYGSAGGKSEYGYAINQLNKVIKDSKRDIKLYISEWGVNAFKDEHMNASSIAGAFTMSFITESARLNIDESLFLSVKPNFKFYKSKNIENVQFPTLFDLNNDNTHHYLALENLSEWGGDSYSCDTNIEYLYCNSYKKNDETRVSIWYLDRSSRKWIRELYKKQEENLHSHTLYIKFDKVNSKALSLRINGMECLKESDKSCSGKHNIDVINNYIIIDNIYEGDYIFVTLIGE